MARQSRQKKTERLDILEQEVARLRARLRMYEPYDSSLLDDHDHLMGVGAVGGAGWQGLFKTSDNCSLFLFLVLRKIEIIIVSFAHNQLFS